LKPKRHRNAYRTDIHERILQGQLGSRDAAGALFVADALQIGAEQSDKKAAFLALGYVMQLSMTLAQWDEALVAMKQDGVGDEGSPEPQLRLLDFPESVKRTWFKHQELDALRRLHLIVRDRVEPMVDDLLTKPQTMAAWHGEIALLLCYLGTRHFVSLTVRTDPDDGHKPTIVIGEGTGKFVAPPSEDHPILRHLFTPEEIKEQHRKEAFAAEYFAHGFTTLLAGHATAEGQAALMEEYRKRVDQSKLDARQWLSEAKSKLFIAPYNY